MYSAKPKQQNDTPPYITNAHSQHRTNKKKEEKKERERERDRPLQPHEVRPRIVQIHDKGSGHFWDIQKNVVSWEGTADKYVAALLRRIL
jgi:hypothetical protein